MEEEIKIKKNKSNFSSSNSLKLLDFKKINNEKLTEKELGYFVYLF